MDLEFSLSRDAIRAVSHFSASKDVRYYLNGVLIECRDGKVTAAATDGYVLGIYRFPETITAPDFEIIVPDEIISRIKRSKFALFLTCHGEQWAIVDAGLKTEFNPIDWKFPDWRRVVPRETDNTCGSYSLDLLYQFSRAAKEFGSNGAKVQVHQNGGGSAALVTLYATDDFLGVIMPKREDSLAPFKAPDWI